MKKSILAALVAALFASAAYAQSSPSSDTNPLSSDRADKAGASVGDRLPLDELDTDDDGMISRNEVQHDNELLSRFSRFDEDGDKQLSSAEYDAYLSGGVNAAGNDGDDADALANEPEE